LKRLVFAFGQFVSAIESEFAAPSPGRLGGEPTSALRLQLARIVVGNLFRNVLKNRLPLAARTGVEPVYQP
jgi:hypothetical protein